MKNLVELIRGGIVGAGFGALVAFSVSSSVFIEDVSRTNTVSVQKPNNAEYVVNWITLGGAVAGAAYGISMAYSRRDYHQKI